MAFYDSLINVSAQHRTPPVHGIIIIFAISSDRHADRDRPHLLLKTKESFLCLQLFVKYNILIVLLQQQAVLKVGLLKKLAKK